MKHPHCLGGIAEALKRIAEHLTGLGGIEGAPQQTTDNAADRPGYHCPGNRRQASLGEIAELLAKGRRLLCRLRRHPVDGWLLLHRNISTPRTGNACRKATGRALLRLLRLLHLLRGRRHLTRLRL